MKKLTLIISLFVIFRIDLHAQAGKILSYQRIAYQVGGMNLSPDSVEYFGTETCLLGDLDGDGRPEIFSTATSGTGKGTGYILSLNSNGNVNKAIIIGRYKGLPDNASSGWSKFGASCTGIGDLDRDGVPDLAIGNTISSGIGGEVFIIFLNKNGTIKGYKVLKSGLNGFTGFIGGTDNFGSSLTCLGDIDKDGTTEIVVGAQGTSDNATENGAIWILSLDSSGTCKSYQKISDSQGGGNSLNLKNDYLRFGSSICSYEDSDGDGVPEFFVGASGAKRNGVIQSVIYGISIKPDKTLKTFKVIADTSMNFGDTLLRPSGLGIGLCNLGDIDGDGHSDIVASSPTQGIDGSYIRRGLCKILFMDQDFRIKSTLVWDSLMNGMPSYKHDAYVGISLVGLGDIDKDGRKDAFVGFIWEDRQSNYGSGYVLFLDGKKYPVSMQQNTFNYQIKLYPNPLAQGYNLLVRLDREAEDSPVSIDVLDSEGRSWQVEILSTHDLELQLSTGELMPGVYLIRINYNNRTIQKTFIIN